MAVYDQSYVHCVLEDVLAFEVIDDQPREGWQGKWQGVVRPKLQWRTELLKGIDSNTVPPLPRSEGLFA